MIYSFQSPEAIAARYRTPRTRSGPRRRAGLDRTRRRGRVHEREPRASRSGAGRPRSPGWNAAPATVGLATAAVGLAILTSGTTGPPKRLRDSGATCWSTRCSASPVARRPPTIHPSWSYWPLGGIGGVCQLITGVYVGKRMVLMEKFSVPELGATR